MDGRDIINHSDNRYYKNSQKTLGTQGALSEHMLHKISIAGRNFGTITGVTEVVEFDNNTITLETTLGRLIIKGHDLHVKRLNLEKGEVDIEGGVDNLQYTSRQGAETVWKRLFK